MRLRKFKWTIRPDALDQDKVIVLRWPFTGGAPVIVRRACEPEQAQAYIRQKEADQTAHNALVMASRETKP